MKIIKYISVLAFTLVVLGLSAQNINTQKSSVEWIGKKIGGQHNGNIQLKNGTIDYKNNQIQSGSFTIDMNTITCTDLEDEGYNQKLVGHLKSDDFFGVNKYPTASFKVTESSTFKNDKANVYGDLTIKGLTQKITFEVSKNKNVFTATLDIDRSKHNVKYGSNSFFDSLGDAAIDDIFNLKIKLITNN